MSCSGHEKPPLFGETLPPRAYSHLGRRDDAAKQIELQQRYAKEQKDSVDARLKEVTTFLTAAPN